MGERRQIAIDAPTVIALLALFIGLGASAYALKPGSVGNKQLAKNAVKSKHIENGTIKPGDLTKKGLPGKGFADGSIGGEAIADGSLGASEVGNGSVAGGAFAANSIGDSKLSFADFGDGAVRATPSASANDPDLAEAAATRVPLFDDSNFAVYGKCFEDADDDTIYVAIVAETKQNGAIGSSLSMFKPGGPVPEAYLNMDTPEDQRRVSYISVGADGAVMFPFPAAEFPMRLISADGNQVLGNFVAAVKNGELTDGNFVYGPGDVCLFGSEVISE